MSTQQNPIGTMFELQRSTIENTQQLFHQSLDAQTRMVKLFADATERSDVAREQGEAVALAATNAYFDAMAASIPGDAEGVEGLRESTLEQMDVAIDANEDAWEASQELVAQNADVFEEFAGEYVTVVDDAFDAFLQGHEQAEVGARRATDAVQRQAQSATEIAIEGAEQAASAVEESAE